MLCGAFYWTIFNAVVFAVPSLSILGQYMGWTGLTDFVTSTAGSCVLSIVCLAIALLIVIFGQSLFKKLSILAIVVMTGGRGSFSTSHSPSRPRPSFIATGTPRLPRPVRLATTTSSLPPAGGGSPDAHPLDLGRELRRHGDRLHALHLDLRHRLRRRRGQVARQDPDQGAYGGMGDPGPARHLGVSSALSHIVDFDFLRAAAYQDFTAAVEGYTLPTRRATCPCSYVASGASPIIAWVASLTFLITMTWLNVIQFIVAQRILFAWGMDRMGPTVVHRGERTLGFTGRHVRPRRRASAMFLVVGYWYLFPSVLAGMVASGMQLISTFLLVAICAIILALPQEGGPHLGRLSLPRTGSSWDCRCSRSPGSSTSATSLRCSSSSSSTPTRATSPDRRRSSWSSSGSSGSCGTWSGSTAATGRASMWRT